MDEASFHALISGQRRGLAAGLSRFALQVASLGYRTAVGLRNIAYDRGWKSIARAPLPVVSIGNLTTGGTGKTPFAAFVARWFRERNVRVCFLSRGYRAREGELNDEALVLDQLCPDVPHLQNPDRVAAARVAAEELESQLLILDDGFQHRRLARDLDIVLIDALNPWGYGHLLPRGLLREPASSLRRAGLIVLTRVDQADSASLDPLRHRLSLLAPRVPVAEAAFVPECLIDSSGRIAPLDSLRDRDVLAVCGIGNPAAFRRTLDHLGCRIADFRTFPDHHPYTRTDIDGLIRWSAAHSAAAVVTTQKDLVKISLDTLGDRPLRAVQIGTRIVAGESAINTALDAVMKKISTGAAGVG